MNESRDRLSVGQTAALACLLEISARKPGNVHRGADFEDVGFVDFAASAVAIIGAFDDADRRVGKTVLQAIRATRRLAGGNTNLGMVLLLAPLAAAKSPMEPGVQTVLAGLTAEDSRCIYQAINMATPGGLGTTEEMDVAGPPPDDLLAAMSFAAERDIVARQYVNGFEQVFRFAVPMLEEASKSEDLSIENPSLTTRIVLTHLRLMNEFPDTLIQRKCGRKTAEQAARMAGAALKAGGVNDERFWKAVGDLDFWLRADGHRRNPGATADLIAAGLFVCLREERIRPPFR